ncbi:MAG: hypothetical protein KIT22_00820 [Verrucomicrobiae bacterium]|nr:hypothetical protein [Verrucomicrobiae bacterium]
MTPLNSAIHAAQAAGKLMTQHRYSRQRSTNPIPRHDIKLELEALPA